MNSSTRLAIAFAFGTLVLASGAQAATGPAHAHKAQPRAKAQQEDWGIAGDARAARRTIEISMSDAMRFTPSSIRVREGETVRFVVVNRGKVLHEMVIGTRKVLDAHAALMRRFPTMEHDEPHSVHVQPGRRREPGLDLQPPRRLRLRLPHPLATMKPAWWAPSRVVARER